MFLENVVFDATDPRALGRFWERALGTETLTDEPEGFETRLGVPDGPVLDLCFQRVPEPPVAPPRLQLALWGAEERESTDPEGNPFRVRQERAAYAEGDGLAALSLAVADPERELEFWSWLSGWKPLGDRRPSLQHSSGNGPLLELHREPYPKGPAKNRIHLDIRLEPGDDAEAVAREIADRDGLELHFDWGDLPWRHFADPSGNEFCVLPAHG